MALGIAASLGWVASALAAPAPPAPPDADPAGRTIDEVRIVGLEELEPPLVRLLISSQAGSPLSTPALRADEEALLASGMFRSARIAWSPRGGDGAAVRVEVAEAPPVRRVEVLGGERLDTASLAAWIEARVQGVPRPDELAAIAREVDRRYHEVGLFACELRERDPLELTEDGTLRVHLTEPKLRAIEVVGEVRVPASQIRRKLVVPRGEVVRQEDLDESVRRLARLGTLRSARFEVARLSEDESQVDLRLVVIEERYFGELALGARYERVNGPVSTFSLTRRNIFRSPVTLRADAEVGVRQSYGLRFQSDWLGGWPISGEAGVHRTERRRESRRGDLITARLEERRIGETYRLSKTLTSGLRLSLGLQDEEVRAEAVDGFLLPANLQAIGGNTQAANYVHQGIELGVSRGPAFEPLTPEADQAWRLDVELAGGGLFKGPGDYTTWRLEGRRLLVLGEGRHLALRARAGAIFLEDGVLPFLEQLALGGSEDLRGLLFKERLGDRMGLVNLEYRRELHRRWTAVAFADWGDAWEHDLRGWDGSLSLGLGVRVDVQLFLLRLDVAKEVGNDDVRIAFGVGHLF